MRSRNAQETKNFIKKEFEGVEKRLKQGEFKNMSELVKEFEVFHEYFRKKCPYKDEVPVGLEFLMKKFADCSQIMYKVMRNKKDQDITKVKEENDKLSSDICSK